MDEERENPFTPNWGTAPPHRAGHKAAESELNEMLRLIAKKRPVGGVVLYGPRGTGKTVLLKETKKQATERGIAVCSLNPNNWGNSTEAFVRRLASGVIDLSQVKTKITVKLICAKLEIAYDPDFVNPVAEEILRRMMVKDKPVALLVDEAHRLPADIADCLLNAAQECVSDGLPLLLVLAGTPRLRANLRRAHASFWERSRRVRIGRLESPDDTRAALSVPTERWGLSFAPDALERLVVESQGYPYFIQLLGMWSWRAAIARDPNADRILLEDAEAGVLGANAERDELYEDRLGEITDRRIKSEALAVSKEFAAIGGDGVLAEAALEAALEPALTEGRTVDDALQELFAVGLIWQTDNPSLWEPAIPSLCTHIAKRKTR